ncbi:hypothetical protein D869_gp127 [Caulobacter phage CcrRogue]|uniref:Uncharacterized protein n=1 Tax=Caulobacter phage CcrRogue TaxID=2927986 RepID=K4K3G5_9CAUD|nr:hypothetical protein D869_gp127 [Caulobacter phage CcrRogue]AFU86787.1 hypothetical protein CcrRogue_gp305 [Caulobacter phage CcrRogue]
MKPLVTLRACPPGVFRYDGLLFCKTEYGTIIGRKDAVDKPHVYEMTDRSDVYCLGSGEYFWGGVETAEDRENLMVEPIDIAALDSIAETDKMVQAIMEAVGFASLYDNGAGMYARNVLRAIQSGKYAAFEALLPPHVPRDGTVVREDPLKITQETRDIVGDAFGTVALIQVEDPEAAPITFTLAEVDALLTAQRRKLEADL